MRTEYVEEGWGYTIYSEVDVVDLIQCNRCKDSILSESYLGHRMLCKEGIRD